LRKRLFLVLLITIALSQLSVTGIARLETITVGNHTVSMNIPDLPQYYISSTVLGNEEAIEIKFNDLNSVACATYNFPNRSYPSQCIGYFSH
jgi:hypothetical protein